MQSLKPLSPTVGQQIQMPRKNRTLLPADHHPGVGGDGHWDCTDEQDTTTLKPQNRWSQLPAVLCRNVGGRTHEKILPRSAADASQAKITRKSEQRLFMAVFIRAGLRRSIGHFGEKDVRQKTVS